VLALEPGEPEALAWRAAIRMVQADYGAAREDCARLSEVASELLATGCAAYVDASSGAMQAAYARLLATLKRHPEARKTLRLWTLTLLADMAQRSGKSDAAEEHYRAALGLGLTDQYLIAAYAEFLLERRRWAEVVALLQPWERSDALLLLLARAERALGRPDAARHARMLRERYEASARRGERLHVQDEARFRLEFLGDAQGALALAVENWSRQKEPRDAELLLEAALAARNASAARPVLDWLARSGFEDPRLARLAADLAGMRK
jgi:predicted Zn-dependent protease